MDTAALSDEQLKFLLKMNENRQSALHDPINIERLKARKIVGKDHTTCDKYKSLLDHVNPEFEKIREECIKRKLI
jgi:hypothetical protein